MKASFTNDKAWKAQTIEWFSAFAIRVTALILHCGLHTSHVRRRAPQCADAKAESETCGTLSLHTLYLQGWVMAIVY